MDEPRLPENSPEIQKRQHDRFRYFTFWTVIVGTSVITGIFLAFNIYLLWFDESVREIIKEHYAVTIGLPMAAVASLVLVVILEASSGPVHFKGMGFEFRGASGQVVLWVLVFLAIAGAIKLLW